MLPSRIACARIDVHTGTGRGRKSSASLRTTGGRNSVAVPSRSTARASARFSGRNRIRSLERSCCGSSLRAWYVIALRRPTSLARRRQDAWNGLRGRYREQRRGISLIIMARRPCPAIKPIVSTTTVVGAGAEHVVQASQRTARPARTASEGQVAALAASKRPDLCAFHEASRAALMTYRATP